MNSAAEVRKVLAKLGSPARVKVASGFFKTGKGQYGEGDVFIGATVPDQRKVARQFRDLPLGELELLLKSKIHEERLTALIIYTLKFPKADLKGKEALYKSYLKHLKWINNWDLVDTTAEHVVGAWLRGRSRAPLYKLAQSSHLWSRRVAMLSCFHYIKKGDSKDALKIAEALLRDEHDLMHKAVGWMLREVGKRVDPGDLRGFLRKHAARMPRTMLRYSIEKMGPAERRAWMNC